jgi:hypothetical protein
MVGGVELVAVLAVLLVVVAPVVFTLVLVAQRRLRARLRRGCPAPPRGAVEGRR